MDYLITPPEPTDWKIDESELIRHLEKQWSGIEIRRVMNPEDYYVLEWAIKVPGKGQRLDGALHRDRQGISLDGYLADCAKFAVWFRSLVPQMQELVFYDQGYNGHVELQAQTRESEVMQPFLALT